MIPQYVAEVQQTRRSGSRSREPRMWSLQWWVRQIVYTLIVLAVVVLGGLMDALR